MLQTGPNHTSVRLQPVQQMIKARDTNTFSKTSQEQQNTLLYLTLSTPQHNSCIADIVSVAALACTA
jgi:hypothetical protein